MKGTMKIEFNMTEQEVVEACLNLHHSGYGYIHLLALCAFNKRWHIDKLMYYKNLIEDCTQPENDI